MKIYQYGSSILKSIVGLDIKDYDFIIEVKDEQEKSIIIKVINDTFKNDVTKNSFGGIKLSKLKIDIDFVFDLNKEYTNFIELNTDDLFFNWDEFRYDTYTSFIENYNSKINKIEVVNNNKIHPNPNRTIQRIESYKKVFEIIEKKNINILSTPPKCSQQVLIIMEIVRISEEILKSNYVINSLSSNIIFKEVLTDETKKFN